MSKRLKTTITVLLFTLAGAAVGYFIGKLIPKSPGPRQPLGWWFVPLLLLMPWLAIAWHEFGHVMGGWLSGFRLMLFTAGPLRIDREGERLRLSWNRSPSLWGGVAATAPPPGVTHTLGDMRNKMMIVVAGGPVASLLGGLLLLPALQSGAGLNPFRFACLIGGATSLAISLATLVPIGNGGFVNDGLRILQLLRGGDAADRWIAGARLTDWSLHARPREWPADLVLSYSESAPATFDGIMARWMRHNWHLDRQEIPEAGHWLQSALAGLDALPASVQPIVHISAAGFHARYTGDPERAAGHWAHVAGANSILPAHALAFTESVVLAAQGRSQEARDAAARAQQGLGHLHGSVREQARETLAWVEQRLLHG